MEQSTEKKIWNKLGYFVFFGAIIGYISEKIGEHTFYTILLGLIVFVAFRLYINRSGNSNNEHNLLFMLIITLILANFTWLYIQEKIRKDKVCKAVNLLSGVETEAVFAIIDHNASAVNLLRDANNDFSRFKGTGILEDNTTEIMKYEFNESTKKKFIPYSKKPAGLRWKEQQIAKILHYCEEEDGD